MATIARLPSTRITVDFERHVRRNQIPDEGRRPDRRQHLRRRAGARLPQEQQRRRDPRHCRAEDAPQPLGSRRCTQIKIAHPIEPVTGNAVIIDAMRQPCDIDRPRFLHVAQPQADRLPAKRPRAVAGSSATSSAWKPAKTTPATSASASLFLQSRDDKQRKPIEQGAAEQHVRQPHRRQGVADRRAIRVGREDEETRAPSLRRARPHKPAAGPARRQSATQNSTIAAPMTAR